MTEGFKSVRARFEKLSSNENQDGKVTQLKSLQSQNPSKLGVFLYRNRNIFSNEEEVNSLERSYQAILKETSNPILKTKSPAQVLDRISKKYSYIRSQVESKLSNSTVVAPPKFQIKRFKADHGSTFYSSTAIHPIIIEEPVSVVDESEPAVNIRTQPETIVATSMMEDTPSEEGRVNIEEDLYHEFEEHDVVSTSPLTNTEQIDKPPPPETMQEGCALSLDGGRTSEHLPTASCDDGSTISSPSELGSASEGVIPKTGTTILEEHIVEFEEEDYMESFEEYDIEETHVVVDITPLTPMTAEEVFPDDNTIIEDASPPPPTTQQEQLVEHTTTITKIEKHEKKEQSTTNVNEKKEETLNMQESPPKKPKTEPIQLKDTILKPLPMVSKEKPIPKPESKIESIAKQELSFKMQELKDETPKSNTTSGDIEKKLDPVEETTIEQHADTTINSNEVKPTITVKELPKPSPSVAVEKPLPATPKKPVKALPIVSPKMIEMRKEIFDVPLPSHNQTQVVDDSIKKPSEALNIPTDNKPEPIVKFKETPIALPAEIKSQQTLSRTASIRSYFSSFLSKPKKQEELSKIPAMEFKAVEKPLKLAKLVKDESVVDHDSKQKDGEDSVLNIDDLLSEEANNDKKDNPCLSLVDEKESENDINRTEQQSNVEMLVSTSTTTIESSTNEKVNEGRKVSITSTTDSQGGSSTGEKLDSKKLRRASRRKSSSPHQSEAGAALLLQNFLGSNPSSRSNSATKESDMTELSTNQADIIEDGGLVSTISETTTTNTHPSPSRSETMLLINNNEQTATTLSSIPKRMIDLYSPVTPKRKEKVSEIVFDPATFPKGWENPYTFLYTEKPLMEHPLLDKLRRNIIDLLTSSMTEETRVSGVVNINRTSPLLAPLVHSIYSILINRTKPTMLNSYRDVCSIFSKLEIVKKERIVQDFLAFKEVRILDPKKLKERDLLFIQYLLQSKLLAVCTYELALNQKYTAVCYEGTSIMNLADYCPTIFAVLNLLKKHFNFELKFEFELSQQAGGSKQEGTLISTLQGNTKTLLQYIIEIGKNEKIPINTITDESKNLNVGKVVRSLVMYILRSILMDKLIAESKWMNIAGTLVSHPWHLITACAKGELAKAGMIVKTGYSFDSIVLTIDSTVKKKNQTTKQQLLDDKFFSFVVYCLNYQILTDALKFIFKNIMILEKNYRPDSIMCDPVQQDQILTTLKPLSKIRFTLNFY